MGRSAPRRLKRGRGCTATRGTPKKIPPASANAPPVVMNPRVRFEVRGAGEREDAGEKDGRQVVAVAESPVSDAHPLPRIL